jgi:hypothetical protein
VNKTMAEQTAAKDPFEDLFKEATDQAVELARSRAALPKATASISRERACLGALVVTAPLFVLVLLVNVWDMSPVDLITPRPTAEVARRQVQGLLDDVVQGIESFRHDYASLPKALVEVGIPARGSWTYSPEPGGRYQVVGTLYGQVVTFDSPAGTVEHERHR